MKPVLSDHVWALKKWSLNTGGLLIKGPVLSGCLLGLLVVVAQDRWSLNTSGHKTGFTVFGPETPPTLPKELDTMVTSSRLV